MKYRPTVLCLVAATSCSGRKHGDGSNGAGSNEWDTAAARAFEAWEKPKKQRDEAAAHLAFQDACEHGSQLGCAGLGAIYLSNREQLEKGIELLSNACAAKVGRACASLATAYESGIGVSRDGGKAVSIARDACTDGEHRACVLYARAMLFGDHGLTKDASKSRELGMAACDHSVASGCTLVGLVYSIALGDAREAQRWLAKGCDGGDGAGCAALATQYFRGGLPGEAQGVTVAPERGVELATRACDLDATIGCSLLAKALANGEGTAQDLVRARELAATACNDSDAAGCTIAARIAQAEGREEDAVTYLTRACTLGNATACRQVEQH